MGEVGRNVFRSMKGFVDRISEDHVGAYAAQAAYFLILSFVPFVLFMMTMVRYTPLTEDIVRRAVLEFVPTEFSEYVTAIMYQLYNRSSAIVPVTAIAALWSAGKGLQAITNGLNSIYHVKETRNWLMTRLWSVFYTLIFVISIISSLILLVFGNSIGASVIRWLPFLKEVIYTVINTKGIVTFFVLVLVFTVLYKVLPNRKASLKSQLPGALLTGIAWSAFSYGFSLYIQFFPAFTNMYGSLTMLILVMLWMYFCMNIVLYGAVINAYYEKQFRQAHAFAKDLFDKDTMVEEELENTFEKE